jgi:hypothetical protein
MAYYQRLGFLSFTEYCLIIGCIVTELVLPVKYQLIRSLGNEASGCSLIEKSQPYPAHLSHLGKALSHLCFLTLQYAHTFADFFTAGIKSCGKLILSFDSCSDGTTAQEAVVAQRLLEAKVRRNFPLKKMALHATNKVHDT